MQFEDDPTAGYLPPPVGGPGGEPLPVDPDPLVLDGSWWRVEFGDSDADGRTDTVAISGPAAGTVLFTDVDGDRCADVATRIGGDGTVTVAERAPEGGWTVVDQRHIGIGGGPAVQDGSVQDGSVDAAVAEDGSAGFSSAVGGSGAAGTAGQGAEAALPAVVIDPTTGEWTEI